MYLGQSVPTPAPAPVRQAPVVNTGNMRGTNASAMRNVNLNMSGGGQTISSSVTLVWNYRYK